MKLTQFIKKYIIPINMVLIAVIALLCLIGSTTTSTSHNNLNSTARNSIPEISDQNNNQTSPQLNQWTAKINNSPIQTMVISSESMPTYNSLDNDVVFFVYSNSITYLYHSVFHTAKINLDNGYKIVKLYKSDDGTSIYALAKNMNSNFNLYKLEMLEVSIHTNVTFVKLLIHDTAKTKILNSDNVFSGLANFYAYSNKYIYLLSKDNNSVNYPEVLSILKTTDSAVTIIYQNHKISYSPHENESRVTFVTYSDTTHWNQTIKKYFGIVHVYLNFEDNDYVNTDLFSWLIEKPCFNGACHPGFWPQSTYLSKYNNSDMFDVLSGCMANNLDWHIGAGIVHPNYKDWPTMENFAVAIYIYANTYAGISFENSGWIVHLLNTSNIQKYDQTVSATHQYFSASPKSKTPFFKDGAVYVPFSNVFRTWMVLNFVDSNRQAILSDLEFGGLSGDIKFLYGYNSINMIGTTFYNPNKITEFESQDQYILRSNSSGEAYQGLFQASGTTPHYFWRLLNPYVYKFKHKSTPTKVSFAGSTNYNIYLKLTFNHDDNDSILWKIPVINAYDSLAFGPTVNGEAIITSVSLKGTDYNHGQINIDISYFGTVNEYIYQDFFYTEVDPDIWHNSIVPEMLNKNQTAKKKQGAWVWERTLPLSYLFRKDISSWLDYTVYINVTNVNTISMNYANLQLLNFTFEDISATLMENIAKYNQLLSEALTLTLNDPSINLGYVIVLRISDIEDTLTTTQVWKPESYPKPTIDSISKDIKPRIFSFAEQILNSRIDQAMQFAKIDTRAKLNKILTATGHQLPTNKSEFDSYYNNRSFAIVLANLVDQYNTIKKNQIVIGLCVGLGTPLVAIFIFKAILNYRFNKKAE